MNADALIAQQNSAPARRGSLLALVPLLVTMPLIYWPKVVANDTQPWVVIAIAIAFLFYRPPPRIDMRRHLRIMTALVPAAFVAYWMRGPETQYAFRYGAILSAFLMLWHVSSRDPSRVIGMAVKVTVVIWFIVGLSQALGIFFGLPVEVFGRYVPGRSGVSSLTPEPSYYGSLSVLHLMYLLSDRDHKSGPYMVLAVCNVLLSGSLLAFVLLAVPILRLPARYKIVGGSVAGALLLIFMVVGVQVSEFFNFERLRVLDQSRAEGELLLSDESTNLRFGHARYTLVDNLLPELAFLNSVDFEDEYNSWSSSSTPFIRNTTDFILPSAGELLFRSGVFGLLVVWFVMRTAYLTGGTSYGKLEKVAFTALCLLNPVSLANPFFIFYVHKRSMRAPKRHFRPTQSPAIQRAALPSAYGLS